MSKLDTRGNSVKRQNISEKNIENGILIEEICP